MPPVKNFCPSCYKPFKTAGDVQRHLKLIRTCLERLIHQSNELALHEPSTLPQDPDSDGGAEAQEEWDQSSNYSGYLEGGWGEDEVGPDDVDMDDGGAFPEEEQWEDVEMELESHEEALSVSNSLEGHAASSVPPEPNLREESAAEELFEGAGEAYGMQEDTFTRMLGSGKNAQLRRGNIYYPFSCSMDFEVGKWLVELGVSKSKIDQFFKLQYVQERPLSFDSSDGLRKKVEQLPAPPGWREVVVEVPGAVTKGSLKLLYRDALECFEYLFGNPIFSGKMEFVPRKVWMDEEKKERLYSEIMTGDMAWDVQSKVSPGETLGLVVLASDATSLTNHQGDKKCHAVYLSCGNIQKNIRSKATSGSWLLIGQIPIATFSNSKLAGMLSARLYHRCMEIILENVIKHSRTPKEMADPSGQKRRVRTIAAAFQADLPEMHTISCTSQNRSPISEAQRKDFGEGKAYKRRTGKSTLSQIEELLEEADPLDLDAFQRISKEEGLNGVYQPFWQAWKFADPSIFLAPDALHQWHKFFADHPLKWAVALLGKDEYDRRLSALQPRVGFRSFFEGVTRFKQHSLRETRDLECSLLAIVAGHPNVKPDSLKAFRGLLDFIYTAQYESQSTATLKYMTSYLNDFHSNKKCLSDAGVRDGKNTKGEFNIPKIELLSHVVGAIKRLGSAPQFSTEQSERAHIQNCKVPYRLTNHKGFEKQICRRLDNLLRVHVLGQLADWAEVWQKSGGQGLPSNSQPNSLTVDDVRRRVSKGLQEKFFPHPVPDVSSDQMAVKGSDSTWLLNRHYDQANIPLNSVASGYGATFFDQELDSYLKASSAPEALIRTPGSLFIWWSVRVQLKDPQDEKTPQALIRLLARPRNEDSPACRNFVLVKGAEAQGIPGIVGDYYVGQLQMLFRAGDRYKTVFSEPLAYVKVFIPGRGAAKYVDGIRQFCPDEGVKMFRVRRKLTDGSQEGRVVALRDIWRPVELVPRFGKACPIQWTCYTAVEEAEELYINPFCNKITYQEVY